MTSDRSSSTRRSLAQKLGGLAGLCALASMGVASVAQARDLNWSIGIDSPGVSVGVSNNRPVVVYPQHGYGAPVYSAPVYGAPVYGRPVYGRPVYDRPVYVHPQPVYQVRPQPYYVQPVVVHPYPPTVIYGRPGYGHKHGHRRGHDRWDHRDRDDDHRRWR